MRKKRSMTLIELVISLGLFSLLLTALLFCYHSFYKDKNSYQITKDKMIEKRQAILRLESILTHAKVPFFSSEEDQGLIFYFDRGIFAEPRLSGTVLGRIFLDKESRCLCFSIWPRPSKENNLTEPTKTFVLLDNVDIVKFKFYHPEPADGRIVNPDKIDDNCPKSGWQDKWIPQFNVLPALIEITFNQNGTAFTSKFDLKVVVQYPKETIDT